MSIEKSFGPDVSLADQEIAAFAESDVIQCLD